MMASNGELKSEIKTYQGFLALMKWGMIASLAVTALVVVLIAS